MKLEDKIAEVNNVPFNDLVGSTLKTRELYHLRYKILYEFRYNPSIYGLKKPINYKEGRMFFKAPHITNRTRVVRPPLLTKAHLEKEVLRVHGVSLDAVSYDLAGLIVYNLKENPMVYNVPYPPSHKLIGYIMGWGGYVKSVNLLHRHKKLNSIEKDKNETRGRKKKCYKIK